MTARHLLGGAVLLQLLVVLFHAFPLKGHAALYVEDFALRAVVEHRCPECGCTNIICDYDSGETVCTGCGLVLDEFALDMGPEWRRSRRRRGRTGAAGDGWQDSGAGC